MNEKSKSEVEVEQRNLADSTLSEAERHEAATEEPATVGCPSLGIPKLPGGFDGVEPGEKSKSEVEVEELKKRGAKLFACNERSREKIVEIAHLANECLLNTNHPNGYAPGQYGSDYRTYGKAMCEIRKIVGPGLAERIAALPPKEKPLDPTAKEMKKDGSSITSGQETASPLSPDEQSARDREIARKLRKIHWTSYPTKVDICTMGKTEQNGKVYEVRIAKRTEIGEYTCATCKVNGKRVMDVKFIGSAWMLNRILTEGAQALVNYKAKRKRDSRRNYKRRDAAAKQQAHDSKEGK